jgi:uncharacterized protein YeaO (DUF488 family)
MALYYPHWGIEDPRFLFDALLYWDRLACIVPHEEFPCQAGWPKGMQREADEFHESFVTGIAPSDEVKKKVHNRLKAFLSSEPPAWCRAENLAPSHAAVIGVRKLSPGTLRMLIEHGWLVEREEDMALISRAASGLLLSTLAEEMASETMPAVTNESATFRAACNGLLGELQSQQGIGGSELEEFRLLGPTPDDGTSDLAIILAKITKLGVAAGPIEPKTMRRLHKLCLDSGFDEQREQFRAHVDRYVADLREHPVQEHRALHDHWEIEMAKDREALQRELRAAGIEAIVEKEGILATGIAVTAGAGMLAVAGPLGPIGLIVGIGLASARIGRKVRKRRIAIRDGRWTSWLVSAQG